MLNVYLEIGGLYTFPLARRVYEQRGNQNDLSGWLCYVEPEEPFVILDTLKMVMAGPILKC